MTKTFCGIKLAIVALLLLGCERQEPDQSQNSKIFSVYFVGSAPGTSALMSNLGESVFNGVPCITGLGVEDYCKGIPIRVPKEKVILIMEYESIDAFNRAAETYDLQYPELTSDKTSDPTAN